MNMPPAHRRSPSLEGAGVVAGQVLAGKYRVDRIVGAGGMGFVVAATHLKLAERVAVKMLRPESMKKPDVVARFAREARAAVKLKGEHVVRIMDVDEFQSGDVVAPFIVMEYLVGSDLGEVLRKRGPLPIDEAVEYVLQACEGMAEAHAL